MKSFTVVALALVGLVALGQCSPFNSSYAPQQGNEMWISAIEHGTASFHPNPSDYQVYRNVMDFGCAGNGIQDDTACINTAISSGGRCGSGCGSSTSPSSAPEFQGMAIIDSNPYGEGGNNWYTNQNNFFRQVRNFIIDTTQTPQQSTTTGIHWQVAQATSLVNIEFKMTVGSNHQGIWMENGSGGFMSDLKFEGGKYGMWVGNQQFLSLRMSFDRCDTAIFILWNWQWSFKSVSITGSRIGIDMSSPSDSVRSGVGSVLLMDSVITDTQTAVLLTTAAAPVASDTSNTLLLDNVRLVNTPTAVGAATGESLLNGGTMTIQAFGRGSRYNDASGNGQYVADNLPNVNKDSSLLDSEGRFFEKTRPQYETLSVNDFASVKAGGARGDGRTDDSDAIQNVINQNVNGKVVYFPSGTYIIGKTITVPAGTRLIGEIWTVLMAGGSVFQDQNNPAPMLKVGEPGQTGNVVISDFMFSTKGAQPGAILVQWNLKGSAPGEAGMWDAHFRVGGFAGSELQVPQCPKGQSAVHNVLLLTPFFTSPHLDLDFSKTSGHGPSEHNVLYQYQLNNARNVYMTMIQSETPYWQPGPPAPQPFTPSSSLDDPTYAHCNGRPQCEMSYSIVAKRSSNVYLYGAGMYNFFYNYDQTCLDTENCQDNMVNVEGNNNLYMFNANTKASVNMVVRENNQVLARQADNKNGFCQSINAFLVESS
ncbi:Glucan 1,3-beta-glucosidase [Orchesella cincta]|uniref:Glucan 1,3-beta-glucosidase n=1 Tax=Orchesella cincta TaxID=48709 RepID=A0A1D2MR99_ORCCI|nr:Glucan 1,3-beta-glucosidase [Orchesella cincta]